MTNPIVSSWRWSLLLLQVILPVVAFAQSPEELANAISYGIPVTPAFELLPGKPSEITNIVTPRDVYATVPSFISTGKLKTGISADFRPFAYSVGSLTEYQQKPWKQALWRTVLAVGTAPDVTNNDAFLSAGLRISIIDEGDPRANKAYTERLSAAYAAGIASLGPPSFTITPDQLKVRSQAGSAAADVERKKLSRETWNKLKVDVGAAYMVRAASGSYLSDSLTGDRWGVWAASGLPLGEAGQLTVTGKASRMIRVANDQGETGRYVVGTRARFFVSDQFALSGEVARLWSTYGKSPNLSEAWTHFAVIVELNVPILGGWLNLAYGGDSAHRTGSNDKFSFSYAVAANRILKK